jgi:RNA polymerase sigma-70 factor, ECF subfamily
MELNEALAAVRAGDVAAFAAVIEHTERRLRAHLALRIPDRELVDEVAHQAYITAFEKLNDFRAGTNFYAWLKSIAVHHLQNECRRRAHPDSGGTERLQWLVAPGRSPEELEEIRDEVAQLQQCMERLGPQARQILHLRYTECLEPSEIGQQLSREASAVRTMLTRVRQTLLQCMETARA